METIFAAIEQLIRYAEQRGLLAPEDVVYARNRLLATLRLTEWQPAEVKDVPLASPAPVLDAMIDWAYEQGLLETNTTTERDIWDARLMDCVMPRPSEVIRAFYERYRRDPQEATDWFYSLSQTSNYIQTARIANNQHWKVSTIYGELDITINLAKPEKDPKEIAKLKEMPSSSYPKCVLCKENEGYEGTWRHPARSNHRVIPITLLDEQWYFQYSPYVYYNEHCIVFHAEHVPMKMERKTLERLLDFVEKFPHYFIGSNADLPIVGGSILVHDHFQGGCYTFAMEKAEIEECIPLPSFPSVTAGIVRWPMSVIRLTGPKEDVLDAAAFLYETWRTYSDPSVEIMAYSGDVPHNTITPIARRRGDLFELDIVLRNNRTSAEHPYGIFHPHEELHHIKKENIGLIEVMGLAVLPARLAAELETLADYLVHRTKKEDWDESMHKHWDWCEAIRSAYPDITKDNVHDILRHEVGQRFVTVLEHAGVFKRDKRGKDAFRRFMQHAVERMSLYKRSEKRASL
ncbi:UDP-glucose--hexose-1-phosphate uridylyltransferase [Geobacillus proteiniphilus]|uniref:Galactose-1-phosphate uridylyltransferase n=1 Tax=Geobacillus proteiniphilus TaxID=860353 RepID=A0A1Q5SLB0_9BACL|nr:MULTISPECIES: UDP-glucose--hexose-1-phosphate uridylyltransferase [Geobacillus]OKO88801.1 Galactose-1-phosphate uridylyltransferase [Geobacillus proteiniphilus]OPX03204.1 UDP-glucose--hexose-1-phosphate uridylyltransferase [Geobacillus sp. LEMMY01]WMJ17460.1 UDP-glucose--hexose-1-phosphate uridylyltransferase [Geobacillus proteiniphilus]